MLLDAYSTVYIWIGNKSNSFEKKGALATAQKYIDNIKDERNKDDVQIVEVEAGKESPAFTVHFPEWRKDKAQKWLDENPITVMKGNMLRSLKTKVEEIKEEASKFLDPKTSKFDLDTLKAFP
jgi:NADH dehydrogenase FAD-containing subunit